MKASFEKLVLTQGESFRCFDRSELTTEIKWHRHPEIEINYVERGCGTRMVGDDISTYGDGDLVLLGGNLPHTWMSDEFIGKRYDRHPSIVIQFLPELFSSLLRLPETESLSRLLDRSRRGLKFGPVATSKIGGRMKKMLDQNGAERLIGLLECLSWMANSTSYQALASRGYELIASEYSDSRIQAVCQYVNSNLTDPNLGHAEVVDLLAMNPSAFSRLFRRSTGRTFTQYVTELRIGLACRLLINSEDSVLDICHLTGFSNLSNFNRKFKKLKKLTPRQFRQKTKA